MTIRRAQLSDAPAIAQLTAELGYRADAGTIADRLARLAGRADHVVAVAVVDGQVGGWLQAHASDALESGFRAEIVGLVVGNAWRRRGLGRRLVDYAERWAAAQGADVVVVRSNTIRQKSHAFYPALGYRQSKTQAVYRKSLGAPAEPPDRP